MPRHTYPFFSFPGRAAQPYLPIRIVNPTTHETFDWYCLVDSGADSSLFPHSIPMQIGHSLKGKGVRRTYSMGVGGATTVWLHSFVIQLMHPLDTDKAVWRSRRIRIGCVESDDIPALLGVSDFLKSFIVTLNYPAHTVTIEW